MPRPCERWPPRRARAAALALAFAALGLDGACLDPGPAPAGRHLVAGRDPETVVFAAGPVGGASRIVFTRPRNVGGVFGFTTLELSAVDDPGPGGAPTPPRLLADSLGQLQRPCLRCTAPVDSLGRFYLDRLTFRSDPNNPGATLQLDDLIRVDPATGEQHDFGLFSVFDISADRTRVAFAPLAGSVASSTLVDVDGGSVLLGTSQSPQFVDDDVFFIDWERNLKHVPRGSPAPIVVAPNVLGFQALSATDRGRLLQVTTDSLTQAALPTTLLQLPDLTNVTLGPVSATADQFVPSPSGRYLAAQANTPDGMSTTLVQYDRDTGRELLFDNPLNVFATGLVWRPGHDEVWFYQGDKLFRWAAGAQPVSGGSGHSLQYYPAFAAPSSQELSLGGDPVFTPDGQFRVVADYSSANKQPARLVPVDDPAAAPFPLTSDGTGIAGLWPLAGGRYLVEAWITDARRNDISLVDPVAGTSRALAATGNVVATGRDRFLALLHWVASGASGDLTLVDYATGAETLVAQNVHSVDVDTSTDPDDALSPGTRVVYLVRNRIASPYDGIWMLALP